MKEQLTQEHLKQHYNYNPLTGEFRRLIANSNNSCVGELAGYMDNGYCKISLDGKQYKAHRLAFLYMTGRFPKYIDHIDRNRSNNRWDNLREATHSENMRNASIRVDNKTGVKGVSRKDNSFYCQIHTDLGRLNRSFNFNICGSEEKALERAKDWITTMRIRLHNEFASHS